MLFRSQMSLGHFSCKRGAWSARSSGSSASAIAQPTASDRPDQSTAASGKPSENVSDAPPSLDCQTRPCRPRPALWCSATSRQGFRSIARRPNAALSTLRPVGLCAGEFTVPDDFDSPLTDDMLMTIVTVDPLVLAYPIPHLPSH